MNTSENFNLKWNDFHENTTSFFGSLWKDQDLSDVTLVCEDTQVAAHKIVLSASSTFFMDLLKRNKNPHPLIYMRGVKARDLVYIVDYIYNGEVIISQEDLNDFLAVAEDLKLKGLSRGAAIDGNDDIHTVMDTANAKNNINCETTSKQEEGIISTIGSEKHQLESVLMEKELDITTFSTASNETFYFEGESGQHETLINSMMIKSDGNWTCTVCGKTTGKQQCNLKAHIENNHIEGLTYSCNKCGQTFKSRNSMNKHEHTIHRKI